MIRPKITFKGVKEAIGDIDAFSGKMLVALDKVVEESANVVASGAKSRLHKPGGIRTGKYARTIKVKLLLKDHAARIAPWVNGRPHPLGHLLEWGTSPHMIAGWGNSGEHPGSKPLPHLFPAFEEERPKFVAKVKSAIRGLA